MYGTVLIRDMLADLRATFFDWECWCSTGGFLLLRVEVATGALQSFQFLANAKRHVF